MKRRQALEAKLFKMKYARLLKLIAQTSKFMSVQTQNRPSSIYQEVPWDPQTSIPQNKYLLDHVIRDAIDPEDSSDSNEEVDRSKTKEQLMNEYMAKLERRNPAKTGQVKGISFKRIKNL